MDTQPKKVAVEAVNKIASFVQLKMMNVLFALETANRNCRAHRVSNGFRLYNAFAVGTFATEHRVHAKLGTTDTMVNKAWLG